jgi:putative membrane protein
LARRTSPVRDTKGPTMLWVKALHIFFVISWFAGLFYLPRLFVYHADTRDAPGHERFVTMERRLFMMMSIGAIGTVVFGVWLMLGWWWPAPAWLHAKLGLVALLLVYHMLCFKLPQCALLPPVQRSPGAAADRGTDPGGGEAFLSHSAARRSRRVSKFKPKLCS